MLASRTDNKIPANCDWIGGKIGATTPVDLSPLFTSGFISEHPDSNALADRYTSMPTHARLEEKRRDREETEAEKKDVAIAFDYKAMFSELWESFPTDFGSKGSRKDAETHFLKFKPTPEIFTAMIIGLRSQIQDKVNKLSVGAFSPDFPHVIRWLKGKRWTDEINQSNSRGNGKLSKSDEADRAYVEYRKEILERAGDTGRDADIEGNGVSVIPAGQ